MKRNNHTVLHIRLIPFIGFLILQITAFVGAQDARTLHLDKFPAGVERRIALVIGNGAYQYAPRLTNPVNDARDMAAALKELGFEVIYGEDQTGEQMKRLIRSADRCQPVGGSSPAPGKRVVPVINGKVKPQKVDLLTNRKGDISTAV
jgi:hypothetical protein